MARSGSPVFAHLTDPRVNENGTVTFQRMRFVWLLGLIHGHYDISELNGDEIIEDVPRSEAINMGMAIVIPANKIIDTLNHPYFRIRRERWFVEHGIL